MHTENGYPPEKRLELTNFMDHEVLNAKPIAKFIIYKPSFHTILLYRAIDMLSWVYVYRRQCKSKSLATKLHYNGTLRRAVKIEDISPRQCTCFS